MTLKGNSRRQEGDTAWVQRTRSVWPADLLMRTSLKLPYPAQQTPLSGGHSGCCSRGGGGLSDRCLRGRGGGSSRACSGCRITGPGTVADEVPMEVGLEVLWEARGGEA
eukprot:CAMPEP_0204511060 /NCGR_PEP_ID=MMETSP0661-20131031/224_1 /ASSEMBLY_ACC=CAM_ASM_000606 /TAXON_ID=109239 /ORGANISM="Alexandrium margalefi, Strain AMGDE01CS-322" /LENGTH=108 /DNA_ID=CAMNT_0051516119 /DNA_START=402 /DNA_END=726 /DNA_ORIENTATION=+